MATVMLRGSIMPVLSDLKTCRKELLTCIYSTEVFLYVGGLDSTRDYRLKISLARCYSDSLILKGLKHESHRGKMKSDFTRFRVFVYQFNRQG